MKIEDLTNACPNLDILNDIQDISSEEAEVSARDSLNDMILNVKISAIDHPWYKHELAQFAELTKWLTKKRIVQGEQGFIDGNINFSFNLRELNRALEFGLKQTIRKRHKETQTNNSDHDFETEFHTEPTDSELVSTQTIRELIATPPPDESIDDVVIPATPESDSPDLNISQNLFKHLTPQVWELMDISPTSLNKFP